MRRWSNGSSFGNAFADMAANVAYRLAAVSTWHNKALRKCFDAFAWLTSAFKSLFP